MNREEKARRLKSLLTQVAPGDTVETLPPSVRTTAPPPGAAEAPAESMALDVESQVSDETIASALEKVATNREQDLTQPEVFVLEAIVYPKTRPVVFVHRDTYDDLPDPWLHLNDPAVKQGLVPRTRSIGRVEVPNLPTVPFGGTAFVVGKDLMMTNRHVAELFTEGLGTMLRYSPGDAEVDFGRRRDSLPDDRSMLFRVSKVEMIHPFWDMAILRMDGLSERVAPLPLSLLKPEELVDRDVVVVGYPARDFRNDLDVQDKIFNRVYNVKRLQPGKIRPRETIVSFKKPVNAMTHDSSTLGGNSGSAVIDVKTGQVVGLHFAGIYLKSNYAVSTYDLARDRRVVGLKLNFEGSLPGTTTDWEPFWTGNEGASPQPPPGPGPTPPAQPSHQAPPPPPPAAITVSGSTAQWTIPISVSITVGQPAAAAAPTAGERIPTAGVEAAGLKMPIIFSGLENRKGYDPDFLKLAEDAEIALPELTSKGKKVAAKLEDDSTELRYHKFSVVMHKGRRLALFTAANVDWRPESRQVPGTSRATLRGFKDGAEEWATDWRIAAEHQLPDVFFTDDNQWFDKGHLVRRDDVCWGRTFKDIQKANGDTYHTTNCSPQIKEFNQDRHGEDNWGDLEVLVQKQTKAEKAILFSGPVFDDDDPVFDGVDEDGSVLKVPIPRRYWKIVVVKSDRGADAYGFVLEQDVSGLEEFAVPQQWRKYLESIEGIESLLNDLVDLGPLKKYDRSGSQEGAQIAEAVAPGRA
jgi:endonuclease G